MKNPSRQSARENPGPVSIGFAILLGYFSIAVAFGVSGRSIGLPPLAVAGFSVFVFAGASQFMAISLIAQSADPISIILATLVLNSRHFVMSMAIRDRIRGRRVPRTLLAFGITDEVFSANATRQGDIDDTDLLTTEVLAYSGWVGGTVAGYAAGGIFPQIIERSMGISLYAMFVALIVPPILRFPRYVVPAIAAGLLNWALQAIGVPVGLALLGSIASTAALFALDPAWSER